MWFGCAPGWAAGAFGPGKVGIEMTPVRIM